MYSYIVIIQSDLNYRDENSGDDRTDEIKASF